MLLLSILLNIYIAIISGVTSTTTITKTNIITNHNNNNTIDNNELPSPLPQPQQQSQQKAECRSNQSSVISISRSNEVVLAGGKLPSSKPHTHTNSAVNFNKSIFSKFTIYLQIDCRSCCLINIHS